MTTIPVSLTATTLTNQVYDIGTGAGTTSYTIPAFTLAGSPETVAYSATISPSTPSITFTGMTSTWSGSTPVGSYVVTVVGTTSPSNVKATGSFVITISNSCSSATISTTV